MVRNIGGATYNGVIKVDETIPAGATATFPQPSWACAGPGPDYTCATGLISLPPGQAVQLYAVVRVPKNLAAGLACEATNKVKIAEAAGGTDQNTDPTDDEAEATMILPGKVAECPGLPPLSNLKLKKTGPDEKCPVVGSDWVCEFTLKVQNFGDTYTSTIQIADALPFGAPAGATVSFTAPAGWSCGGPVLFPNLYQCSSDNPNLPHLGSAEILAKVKVPVAPGAQCAVTNNALITKAPGGTLLNSFAGDDMSSATAVFAPVFPLGGGQGICVSPAMGEPEPPLKTPEGKETNLTITKTAGPSAATPTGQNTVFIITVTNKGPGVYNGPIEVRDTLFDGATVEPSNGTWSAPWTCEGQAAVGHPEQGICTHPEVELDPGDSVVLTLEIEAPNSFVAPTGSQVTCGYENKVEILKPAGGTPQNTNAGDDIATAEVNFAPFEKHGQTFCEPGLITPPPACPQGWSRTPVPGKCCPPRSAWDGERCKRDVTPPAACVPGPNEVRTPQGNCVCKPGFERDKRGNCVKIVPPEICIPGKSEVRTPQGNCVCKPGYERDKRGNCVEPIPACIPGKNEMRNDKGQCVCKPGFERDKRGNCVASPPPACPGKNEVRNDKGQCVCKPGFQRDNYGRCVKTPSPEEECKKKGWNWNDKRKTCTPPLSPAEECKKKGWNWNDKRKACTPPLSPAEECKKKGWIWNDKRKSCSAPSDPAAECRKKGGVWDGKRCSSPAEACKAKGWRWDGKACRPPAQTIVPR